MASGHDYSLSFTVIDTFRARSKTRIATKPNLGEDDRHVPIVRILSQDEIDFTEFARIVSRQRLDALSMQVIFRHPFRPGAALPLPDGHGMRQILAIGFVIAVSEQ